MKHMEKSRMRPQDKYLLMSGGPDRYRIVHDDANTLVGVAYLLPAGRFAVKGEGVEIVAIVNSLNEVIPAITAYYEANPPQWKPEHESEFRRRDDEICCTRYINETIFGPLWVEEIALGQWVAYRNDCELLFNGKIAIFATCEEAQRAADAHFRDGYPNSEMVDDGYSWIFSEEVDWQQDPNFVANRALLIVHPNTN